MPPSEVLIRLGSHAEKEYLLKTSKLFSGVIIGANLLEMTPGASVSLAWKFSTAKKQFAIDPLTYLFSLDQEFLYSNTKDRKTKVIKREMKKSFQILCEEFGGPFRSVALLGRKCLRPSDFDAQESIDHLAQCVFSYQVSRMKKIAEADPQLKDFGDEAFPSFIFSPYFYVPGENEPNSFEWESVNSRALTAFGKLSSPVPKHAVFCFARRVLKDRNRLLGLLTRAMESGCDAGWFWVSNLREEDITEAEIANLAHMIKFASAGGFGLFNLHGGFLSALLSKHGLLGFSHSIGYGESKDVFPVNAGALPTVAYHYNPLHVKSSVLDIERAFSTLGIADADAFHRSVCDCSICVGTLRGSLRNFRKFGELVLKPGNIKESQTAESAKRCRFHFLLARKKELDYVNGATAGRLREDLAAVIKEYDQLPPSIRLRERSFALKTWIREL